MYVIGGGGFLTQDFDASVFPKAISPQPGPFKVRRPGSSSSTAMADGQTAADSDDDPVYVKFVYLNRTYLPAEGAHATANTVSSTDPDDNHPVHSEAHSVPSTGIVAFTCPGSGLKLEGAASLPSTSEIVGAGFLGFWEAYPADCGDTIQFQGSRTTYMPWDHLKDVIPDIDDAVTYSRSRVNWRYKGSQTKSTYSKSDDRITFGSNSYYRKWVAAHEYGHALHHLALGGMWYTGLACLSHKINKPSSYACAFSEGFADYTGTVGHPDRSYIYNLETHHTNAPSGRDEGEIEGNIAALFWDLLDNPSNDDDDTSYGADYVFGVFRTCEYARLIRGRTTWYDRNAVPGYVWCLKEGVDKPAHRKHFPRRGTPTDVRESVTEPSNHDADDIRETWKQNVG